MFQDNHEETVSVAIVIPTRYLEQTVSFYRDVVGLPFRGGGECGAVFSAGTVNIQIHRISEHCAPVPTDHGVYLSLIVEKNMERIDEQLTAASGRILEKSADGRIIRAFDPNGNLVQLIGLNKVMGRPSHFKMQMLISHISQVRGLVKLLIRHLSSEVQGDAVLQIGLLHDRLSAAWDDVKQWLDVEPASEAQEQAEETSYRERRAELAALGTELYSFISIAAQKADVANAEEVQELVKSIKELIDSIPTLPE